MGSESSAASGRRSEMSEWPRSKFQASAVRQRGNFGHRNRTIGPYGCVARGAVADPSGASRHPAHRRANRFPATVVAANRGTSSKSARFFRHWRRFGDFPLRRGGFGDRSTDCHGAERRPDDKNRACSAGGRVGFAMAGIRHGKKSTPGGVLFLLYILNNSL